jgi:signal transduction histidine kinase/DNA-binding response OmpR family regulator
MHERDDASLPGFLRGEGELGTLVAGVDWSATSLGPLADWPGSLRTAMSLILNSRHPMWIGWGPEVTFLYNDAYVRVLGSGKHPWALGRPAAEVWSEIWDICGPLADQVFRDGEASFVDDVRLFMNRPGGRVEETWYSFSYSPIRDETGRVAGLFCPSTESTERNLNARRLATLSELSATALIEKSEDAACATAAATLSGNPADLPFVLLYLEDPAVGVARLQAAVGLARGSRHAPEAVPLTHDAIDRPWPLRRVLATGEAERVVLEEPDAFPLGPAEQPLREALALPLTASGQDRPIGVMVAGVNPTRPLDAEHRTFFALAAGQVAMAIQNARAVEEEKRRADLLAELDRAKTAFFSNVSHEFRTPLALMLGPLEDALHDRAATLPGRQRERVEVARRNALRLQKLVNTLLDFSRLQAGHVKPAFMPTDVTALTTEIVGSFRPAIERAGLSLELSLESLAEPVFLDPSMWERIVLNLLSNALKFTFEGGLGVTLGSAGGEAVLAVSDTGVGIAPEDLPRVFERFHRVEVARARTHEGSGIGLALVRDLLGLHGGSIEAASEPGRGSTFTVRVPLGHAHLPPEQVVPASPGAAQPGTVQAYVAEAERWLPAAGPLPLDEAVEVPADAPLVVIADDNADMRDYLARLLGARWRVRTVADGEAALEIVQRDRPALVVSYVMMPRMDGFELLARLRHDDERRHVPVMLVSARAGEEARVEALQAGADDYLVKPFLGRELVARVESQLLRARMRALERDHAQRMSAVFQQAPVAIAILRGPQHVYELANPGYLELVGHRPLVGRPIRDALPELEGQGILELLDDVFRTGEPFVGQSMRTRLARERGGEPQEAFFDFVYQPMHDEQGAVESIAVVAFDVTAVTLARRSAEVASRAKDEFLAMLGHELRNPLAPILTAVQLMKLKEVPAAEREIGMIERQSKHLVRLVDDLLDIARVTRGKIELRRERMELADVVARAVEVASPLLEERRHQLTLDVPPRGLPVDVDPGRFTQVVANLLNNAAKYTEPRGAVTVRARREGSEAVLEVRDTGIGISADMLPRVFEMFVQESQSLDRSHGGLGLGLAIVRSLVELHQGRVSASSEGLGRGSGFEVRVPLSHAGDDVPEAHPPEAVAVPLAPDGGRRRVLVVDDNVDAAQGLVDALRRAGHDARAAFDGPTALELVRDFCPEVALLDIGLPGMDGYELAARLRDRGDGDGPSLVAISGYGLAADQERSARSGFDRHLVKPVDLDEVVRLVAEPASRPPG